MHHHLLSFFAAALVAVLLLAGPAGAAEHEEGDARPLPAGTLKCVNTANIRNTRIVDDSTIVFYMLGGDIYVNQLPRRCPGLKIAGTFSYKTSINRLCDVDIITVIRPGMGAVRGPSCGLGKFRPVSEEEVDLLMAEPEPDTESDDVVPEIQAPDAEEDASGAAQE